MRALISTLSMRSSLDSLQSFQGTHDSKFDPGVGISSASAQERLLIKGTYARTTSREMETPRQERKVQWEPKMEN